MFLTNLATTSEKEAFVSLAYLVAKADGSLDGSEKALIDSYMEELEMDPENYHILELPLSALCHRFSDTRTKQLVYANLLSLAHKDDVRAKAKQYMIEFIQHELCPELN